MYIAFLLLTANPAYLPAVDYVDRVEVNHVFSEEGKLCFDQIIWWIWSLKTDRYEVVAWRLLKGVRVCDKEAEKKWNREHAEPYVPEWIGGHATPRDVNGRWVSEWYDEKTRKHRRVIAKTLIESAFAVDIEVREREMLPESKRRGLR